MLSKMLRAASRQILFIGSATYASASNVVFGSSAIAGVQAGDLLLVAMGDDFSVTQTPPAGWTTVFNDTGFDSTSMAALVYKVATSSDTSFTTTSSGTRAPASVMVAFRNAAFGNSSNSGTNTLTAPTITVSSNKSCVLVIGFGQDTTTLYTFPANYLTGGRIVSGNGNNSSSTGIGYRLDVSAGSVSPGNLGGVSAGDTMRVTTAQLNLS
jgi:hypothetical protein